MFFDFGQLAARDRSRQGMDAQLGTHAGALINAIRAIRRKSLWQVVVAEGGGALVIFAGLVHSHPALNGRQDLAALETEDTNRAPRPYRLTLERRALRLRRIFQHDQTMLP